MPTGVCERSDEGVSVEDGVGVPTPDGVCEGVALAEVVVDAVMGLVALGDGEGSDEGEGVDDGVPVTDGVCEGVALAVTVVDAVMLPVLDAVEEGLEDGVTLTVGIPDTLAVKL